MLLDPDLRFVHRERPLFGIERVEFRERHRKSMETDCRSDRIPPSIPFIGFRESERGLRKLDPSREE